MNHSGRNDQRGFTLMETTVAAAMLAVLVATMLPLLRSMAVQQREAERRALAMQALGVLSEQAANLPWDEVDGALDARLELPELLLPHLPDALINVSVNDETNPTRSRRVVMRLGWRSPGTSSDNSVSLTTWVFPAQVE